MNEAAEYVRFATERARHALDAIDGEHADQSPEYQLGYVTSALRRLVDALDEQRVETELHRLGTTPEGRSYARRVLDEMNRRQQ